MEAQLHSVLLWFFTTRPDDHFMQMYTSAPVDEIANLQNKKKPLAAALSRFKEGKQWELGLVKIVSILSITASIAALKWPLLPWEHYWLAPGCWYCSTLLATFAFILAMQQIAVIGVIMTDSNDLCAEELAQKLLPLFVGPVDKGSSKSHVGGESEKELEVKADRARTDDIIQYEASKKMLLVWHCPSMLVGLSVKVFIFAIVPHITTSLFKISTPVNNALIETMLHALVGVAAIIFVWSSISIQSSAKCS